MSQSQNVCLLPVSSNEALARLRRIGRGEGAGESREFRGASLVGENLADLDLSDVDLTDADLTDANLAGARLMRARLCGASLVRADLTGTEFAGADLSGANLEAARGARAGFGMAKLARARMFQSGLQHASLTRADLTATDLRCADLTDARLRDAVLAGADLTAAILHGADLSLTEVRGATFDDADLRNATLRKLRRFEHASWIGVDIRDVNFAGAYRLRRFVVDQNYLREFRDSGTVARWLYRAWWITSDCGDSLLRWFAWILGLTVLFAWVYTLVDVDFGAHRDFLASLYFSVVTMTTLGYGDILPTSGVARAVVMVQVLLGYMMLGGLLTIFNNKMARRGE